MIGVGTADERVQVGAYVYWHIRHTVGEGQWVRAYSTVVGRVILGFHHLHLSELSGRRYLTRCGLAAGTSLPTPTPLGR